MVRSMKQYRLAFMVSLLALTACESGEVRDSLGLGRTAPDEFVVVSRPALSVPPEFTLVPPEPGAEGPRASTEEMAREALIGTTEERVRQSISDGTATRLDTDFSLTVGTGAFAGASSLPSDSLTSDFSLQDDGAMARRASAAAVAPVETSTMGTAAESRFLNQVGADKADPKIRAKLGEDVRNPPEAKEEAKSLYESMIGAESTEPVLDPKGEAERLRSNKDKGKKPNEGKVVTEDKKKSPSVLDTLF